MRWDDKHQSPDVVDRRGQGPARAGLGAFVQLIPLLLRTRFGWVVLLLFGAYYVWGQLGVSSGLRDTTGAPSTARTTSRPDDELARFAGFVLDDAQTTWENELGSAGRPYRKTKLVLFTNATQTGCGFGQTATGPFYCPADERVYIDLGFYRELDQRLGARGDFAQAYVIAHEIGHHVQHVLGITGRAQARGNQEGASGASVRVELQADCFAGVWAHSAQSRALLEPGDIDEAMGATAAIGDDRLQRQSTGTVRPETFTHGTSQQRGRWFRQGLESGKIEACDTFKGPVS